MKFKNELKRIITLLLIIASLLFAFVVFPELMGGSTIEMIAGLCILFPNHNLN